MVLRALNSEPNTASSDVALDSGRRRPSLLRAIFVEFTSSSPTPFNASINTFSASPYLDIYDLAKFFFFNSPMSDADSAALLLDFLRHKRAYRRGQVTKVKTKVQRLQELHPDDVDALDVDNLLVDLQSQLATHEALQTQMDEVVAAHPTLATDEEEVRDRIADTHRAVRNSLLSVQQALALWCDSTVLLEQIEQKLDSPRADSPMFGPWSISCIRGSSPSLSPPSVT